jgi:hypothetical protein
LGVNPAVAIGAAILIPILFVALSYAIAESSKILANSETIPFDKSFKILVLEELLHF